MDKLEQRMEQAAEEVRHTTRTFRRPDLPLNKAVASRRGWLVFATAFAAVIVVVGVLPMLGGGDQPGPVGSPDTTVAMSPPSTNPAGCSSSGRPFPGPVDSLPAEVAGVRRAIAAAALACDFATLVDLAGDRFTSDFGGGGSEMLEAWESAGEGKLGILLQILDMSHSEVVYEDGSRDYVWPAAFAYHRWEDIPQEYLDELQAIYTVAELEQLSGFGSYAGWRTGISEDGDWRYFVAGD